MQHTVCIAVQVRVVVKTEPIQKFIECLQGGAKFSTMFTESWVQQGPQCRGGSASDVPVSGGRSGKWSFSSTTRELVMLAQASNAALRKGGRPHASRSGFSAPIMVSKTLTLGSGCGMSMYSKATEMNTLKFTISGCCIGDPGYWTLLRKFELGAVLQEQEAVKWPGGN